MSPVLYIFYIFRAFLSRHAASSPNSAGGAAADPYRPPESAGSVFCPLPAPRIDKKRDGVGRLKPGRVSIIRRHHHPHHHYRHHCCGSRRCRAPMATTNCLPPHPDAARRIDIYSQVLISTIRIVDIKLSTLRNKC